MATRLFSDAHLEHLRSFPDIDRDQLIGFFTLTPADVAFIDPGRGRGPADRLGLAVQLCTLPWLGFVPDEVAGAPGAAVYRLAERLQVDPVPLPAMGGAARPALIICGWWPATWDGTRHRLAVSATRSCASSCSTGRWSTIRRRCCSAWPPAT